MGENTAIMIIACLIAIGIFVAYRKSSKKSSDIESSTPAKLKINMYEEHDDQDDTAVKTIISFGSEQRNTIDGKWTCPNCETLNDNDAASCVVCGASKQNR